MSEGSVAASRRGPRPFFDNHEILAAAVRLLDSVGANEFKMRALAIELGTSTMTVYNYFPNKAALLDAVIDSVLGQIELPDADLEPWSDELRRYARRAWDVQAPHAWLPALLVEQNIIDRPVQAESRRALLALFRGASDDAQAAREAVGAFFSFMIGSFMQVRPTPSGRVSARADALFDAGVEILIAGLEHRFGRNP